MENRSVQETLPRHIMASTQSYEFLVLGSGEAGKYLAWTMAKAGRRAAVIERRWIGGACPNMACLPSKNIIHSAYVATLFGRGEEFGMAHDTFQVDMKGVQHRKQQMVESLVDIHSKNYTTSGAHLIMGEGRFVAPGKIEVRSEDGSVQVLEGERIFLNLGTRAAVPDVPGLVQAAPLTHVEALNLDRLPDHLIVLGGGYVGLEFAQAMRRFGSRVTIIEQGPQIAGREDGDVAHALQHRLEKEGIAVMLNTRLLEVEGQSGRHIRVRVETANGTQTIEATDILVAAGCVPNTQDIGLEIAGVELDQRGYIKVNERLETTAANVWAMGDCAGSPQFTHVSYDDFRIVRANLEGGQRTTRDRLVPYCMFTDPEVGRVGLNESEAQRDGIAYRIVRLPLASVLRTRTLSETYGFLKALVAADSDRIIGFTAVGTGASELIAVVQMAMLADMPYTALRDAVFTHPTMAEGLTVLFAHEPHAPAHA